MVARPIPPGELRSAASCEAIRRRIRLLSPSRWPCSDCDASIVAKSLANLLLRQQRNPGNSFVQRLGDAFVRQLRQTLRIVEWNIELALPARGARHRIKAIQIETDCENSDQPEINTIFDAHRISLAESWPSQLN